MTNVKPQELNYDHYEMSQYDEDIVNSIPGHKNLHEEIAKIARKIQNPRVLELGVGTGLTTEVIAENSKNSRFILVDFSKQMLEGAKRKLRNLNCKYVLGDFLKIDFPKNCDIVVNVIGFHHQKTEKNKKLVLKKIYDSLNKGGVFILGDLMTYEDEEEAALNDAFHFHHLVKKAKNNQTLKEWAHHHKYLNELDSWQNHMKLIKEVGLKPEVKFTKFNTFLIVGKK